MIKHRQLGRLPVVFKRKDSNWRIECGSGKFLIAEGAGFSTPIGMALFHQLKWGKAMVVKPKRVTSVSVYIPCQ